MTSRRIPDGELNFVEDCLAVLEGQNEAIKRAIYYAESDDELEQLRAVKASNLQLKERLQTWLEARRAVTNRDEIDYNLMDEVIRDDVMEDRLRLLLQLFEAGYKEVAELRAWVSGGGG